MKAAAVTLVIVLSTNTCVMDNINGAKVHSIPMSSEADCEAVASDIDPKAHIRAYCDPRPGGTP